MHDDTHYCFSIPAVRCSSSCYNMGPLRQRYLQEPMFSLKMMKAAFYCCDASSSSCLCCHGVTLLSPPSLGKAYRNLVTKLCTAGNRNFHNILKSLQYFSQEVRREKSCNESAFPLIPCSAVSQPHGILFALLIREDQLSLRICASTTKAGGINEAFKNKDDFWLEEIF